MKRVKILDKRMIMFSIYTIFVFLIMLFLNYYLTNANIALGWQIISWISTIAGIACVILVAMKDMRNYAIGVIAVVTYGFISFHAGYIYEGILYISFLIPVQVIGLRSWLNHEEEDNSNKVVVEKYKYALLTVISSFILIFLFSTVFYEYIFVFITGTQPTLPYLLRLLDTTSTVFSIIAQILMIKRYQLQWVFWIIINIISIFMWGYQLLQGEITAVAILIMNIIYLINSFYGYYNWREK